MTFQHFQFLNVHDSPFTRKFDRPMVVKRIRERAPPSKRTHCIVFLEVLPFCVSIIRKDKPCIARHGQQNTMEVIPQRYVID